MKYMGSKARIAEQILPIILSGHHPKNWYIEPFAGGMNIIDKVPFTKRVAADINPYLIALWEGISDPSVQPIISIDKQLYDAVRDNYNKGGDVFDDFTTGWVGFMASANGRFFDGGYAGMTDTKLGTVRNYVSESIRNIHKQLRDLAGVKFIHRSYDQLNIPPNSTIYCDPPYQDTKQYSSSRDFNHDAFWQWCRDMHASGHRVFISEYDAPLDFKCVWQGELSSSLSANGHQSGGNKLSIEKLFTLT